MNLTDEDKARLKPEVVTFSLTQKMACLSMRFYGGQKWEPKEGDFYCLTREWCELFIISRTDGENFFIRRVCDTQGANEYATQPEQSDPWPIKDFLSGFGVNRVYVHPVNLLRVQ